MGCHGSDLFGALVACREPMEGVDVVDELLDGVCDSCHCACGEEEQHQEEVEQEEELPVVQMKRPAAQTTA